MDQKITALAQFLRDSAQKTVHEPSGKLPHQFVTPTSGISPSSDDHVIPERSLTGHYLQMYDWDAYFFCQKAKSLALADLPLAVLQNFLSWQTEDGYIPRTVSPNSIWDEGDLCKPFLCQLASEHLGKTPGQANLSIPLDEVITKLDSYLNYWISRCRHASGLFHWRNALESGVDNNLSLLVPTEAAKNENPEFSNFIDGRLIACDVNSYLVNEFRAFAELTSRLHYEELSRKYHFLALEIQNLMEDILWDENLRMYTNYDPQTKERVKIRSWTGLLPAIYGICEPKRGEITIEQNLKSEEHFFRKSGLASVAASEPLYNQAKRGMYGRVVVSNWQGPMWVLPNVLACRSLLKFNQEDIARKLANRVIETMANALSETGTTFENYNCETGQALWAPQFVSWNILALELIQLIS